MAKSSFRDGCPMTAELLDLAPEYRAVAEAGRKAYALRLEILRDKLIEDGYPESRAVRLASLCTSALQGALIESPVQRSAKPLQVAAAELADMFEESTSTGS